MLKFTFSMGAARRTVVLKSTAIAIALAAFAPAQTENAVANGDTRTLTLYHSHTHESITATFRVNGAYDMATLEKLNHFLRDWRNDEPTKMDPRLFDAVWEAYRESGSREPIVIVSAYRSPETNAMLRRRSRAVAEFSQHMLGKAMDMHYTDVPMSRIREIAMHLQRGGVGYYPTSGTPFVHMDVGSVRAWPRMSYEQLSRLFPDGKTVHLPSNGQPLARYEEARAEIEARNGVMVPTVAQVQQKGFFETLFGGRGEDDRQPVETADAHGGARIGGDARVAAFIERSRGTNAATRMAYAAMPAPARVAPAPGRSEDANPAAFYRNEVSRGAPAAPAQPAPPTPVQVAALAADPRPQKPTVLADPVPANARQAFDASAPAAPMPPRRPTELALNVAALDAPLPPSRPAGIGADPAPVKIRTAELPSVITTGGSAPVAASMAGALAYAPASSPLASEPPRATARIVVKPAGSPILGQAIGLRAAVNLRKTDDTATHVDRANFRALTSPRDIAHADVGAIAPVVTGLRQAARSDLDKLVFAPPTALLGDYGVNAFGSGSFTQRAAPAGGADHRADLSAGDGVKLN